MSLCYTVPQDIQVCAAYWSHSQHGRYGPLRDCGHRLYSTDQQHTPHGCIIRYCCVSVSIQCLEKKTVADIL